jgi:hypothetical protein
MRQLYENQQNYKTVSSNYERFKRRLDEMEYIFCKTTRNASQFKEHITRFESAATALQKNDEAL